MDSTTTSQTTTPPPAIDHAARASSIHSVAPFSSNEPRWIRSLAGAFEARDIHPQTIVSASLIAGMLGALFLPLGTLVQSGVGTTALVLAAVAIQVRIIGDAVADRMYGPAPARHPSFYSGIPDLLIDAFMVVAAGYGASGTPAGPVLGWTAALLGLLLAYVRTLNTARRILPPWAHLATPMHRMWVLTGAALVAAILPYGWSQVAFMLGLTAIGAACAAAIWARIASRPCS